MSKFDTAEAKDPNELIVVHEGNKDVRQPNMYCRIDNIEFFWTRWNSNDALPICPFHSIERNTLDWIGT